MAWLWLRLCISFQIPGFYANLLITQTPKHITAQAGNGAQLLCELRREHAGVYWYRWSQEKQNFEFLMFSSPMGKATYGTNMSQEKFSAHGASAHTYSLHISHLHASDNGIYYCSISQSSQLILGTGTRLSVVDALPLPPKTTQAPLSTKALQCVTKSKAPIRKGACSPLVWVPLATTVLVLLLSLIPIAHRFYRMKRRLWLRIHRQ
ncbi:T-cell surface glycoprotein CD8 beta chain [Melopsittacus undulatus]|uniref:T-cell surface glycoprotein CD8 beta chain n=1 Tax=Melopsittacus undulatus TaxID=13146 RepID=UPI00146B241D|nr:T-cell surface glycoprotein CD8 beta chain [Melopsittacus undulatus]